MDHQDYAGHDAIGLAELVRTGASNPQELLDAAVARLDAVDPQLNSVVHRMIADATARAAAPTPGPFSGVPFLLKDLHQELAGHPDSAGSRALADRPATVTAPTVARLLAAGLNPFGRTNVPEFGSKAVTEPAAFGPCRNPWDTDRTPGGSSGGSAAAVAAGVVPAATASDGGGSIRIPAACCGLFGLKVSRGLIGGAPLRGEWLHGLATDGLLSRSVRDTASLLDVLIASDDPAQDEAAPYLVRRPDPPLRTAIDREPRQLRIGMSYESTLVRRANPDAVAAVEAAGEVARSLGHLVTAVSAPVDDAALAEDFLTFWFAQLAQQVEEVRLRTGSADVEDDTRIVAALGRSTSAVDLLATMSRWHEYTLALSRFHQQYDLLLTPTLAAPPVEIGAFDPPDPVRLIGGAVAAVKGGGSLLDAVRLVRRAARQNLAWTPYTQLANLTGRPAMSVPLHWTPDGLPLGVQFVGPLGSEPLLLSFAAQLERAAPWWDRRPPL